MSLFSRDSRPCWPWIAVSFTAFTAVQSGCGPTTDSLSVTTSKTPMMHVVKPSDDLQRAIDLAALELAHGHTNAVTLQLSSGVYRPMRPGEAFIRFGRRHDGITLEAVGDVTLTATNPDIADRDDESFPALVNHVVYFGDGISNRTVLKGVRIIGANCFVTSDSTRTAIEADADPPQLEKGIFYYLDGGAIKVFGRSYPTIDRVVIEDNVTKLCGAGISIEHRGFRSQEVVITNSVFRNNRCPGTGAAIDVLSGSAARIENCLFVGNISNTGMDQIARDYGLAYNSKHGCGALTVFPNSRVDVRRCTFTKNWNGADDQGTSSSYKSCIFWDNSASDGSRPGHAYELDILNAEKVADCFISQPNGDLRGTIDDQENWIGAPDPQFDESFCPRADAYQNVGYRPVSLVP